MFAHKLAWAAMQVPNAASTLAGRRGICIHCHANYKGCHANTPGCHANPNLVMQVTMFVMQVPAAVMPVSRMIRNHRYTKNCYVCRRLHVSVGTGAGVSPWPGLRPACGIQALALTSGDHWGAFSRMTCTCAYYIRMQAQACTQCTTASMHTILLLPACVHCKSRAPSPGCKPQCPATGLSAPCRLTAWLPGCRPTYLRSQRSTRIRDDGCHVDFATPSSTRSGCCC